MLFHISTYPLSPTLPSLNRSACLDWRKQESCACTHLDLTSPHSNGQNLCPCCEELTSRNAVGVKFSFFSTSFSLQWRIEQVSRTLKEAYQCLVFFLSPKLVEWITNNCFHAYLFYRHLQKKKRRSMLLLGRKRKDIFNNSIWKRKTYRLSVKKTRKTKRFY